MAKSKKVKGKRWFEVSYPIYNGAATRQIIVKAKDSKKALKNADQYMIPSPDNNAGVIVNQIIPRSKDVLYVGYINQGAVPSDYHRQTQQP